MISNIAQMNAKKNAAMNKITFFTLDFTMNSRPINIAANIHAANAYNSSSIIVIIF